MKQALIILLIAVAFTSCKKDVDNRAYSTWYINGQKFSSNNTYVTKSAGATSWACGDENNNTIWAFFFVGGISGDYNTLRLSSNRKISESNVEFTIGKSKYILPNNRYIEIVPGNSAGKIQFNLTYTWFYNENQVSDSVIISGTFSEP